MPMNETAPVSLSKERVAEIIALSQREFDDREAKIKTTMVSDPTGPERPMKRGYKAVRSHGRSAYEIEANADLGHVMASGMALAILKDGKARQQVGALTDYRDGRALVRFSRSEKGAEAENLFASGDAQLAISTTRTRQGQDRPVALTMRASKGASKMENEAQQIAHLGQKHGLQTEATAAIAAGTSLETFRSTALDKIGSDPLNTPAVHNTQRQFSIGNVIRAQISGNWDNASFEREVSQELARNHPTQPRGIVVPSLMTRTTMTTSNVTNLVESLPRGDLYIESLQPQSAVMAAGATMLSGLGKAITIPKGTGDLTASFVAEGSAIAESNLTIGSLSLSPKRVSSTASFTLEALVQSDPSIDNLVRNDLTRQIAQAIDDAALEGDGSGANPTGIGSTSGINTLATTGSSTMTHAEALTALSKLEEDNVSSEGAVFIMHPTNYATLASTVVDSGSGRFVIDNGTILGRRVIQSTLCTAGTVYLGQYRECMVAMFGGVDLVIDNYSEARSAKVLITQHQMVDVAIRHPVAFCKITLTA